MRYRKLLDVIDEKSRQIYKEKWSEVGEGGEKSTEAEGPMDVISSLSKWIMIAPRE
jgi:hypothetical protein